MPRDAAPDCGMQRIFLTPRYGSFRRAFADERELPQQLNVVVTAACKDAARRSRHTEAERPRHTQHLFSEIVCAEAYAARVREIGARAAARKGREPRRERAFAPPPAEAGAVTRTARGAARRADAAKGDAPDAARAAHAQRARGAARQPPLMPRKTLCCRAIFTDFMRATSLCVIYLRCR